MEAVQIEETATILRFVVMFASGDGLAVLFAASNATDWGLRDVRNRADRSVQGRPPGAPAPASQNRPEIEPGSPLTRCVFQQSIVRSIIWERVSRGWEWIDPRIATPL